MLKKSGHGANHGNKEAGGKKGKTLKRPIMKACPCSGLKGPTVPRKALLRVDGEGEREFRKKKKGGETDAGEGIKYFYKTKKKAWLLSHGQQPSWYNKQNLRFEKGGRAIRKKRGGAETACGARIPKLGNGGGQEMASREGMQSLNSGRGKESEKKASALPDEQRPGEGIPCRL